MNEQNSLEDKEQSLISHLLELRDRLLRCVIAVIVPAIILAFIWPKAAVIYDLLAKPMIDTLPAGTKMIATGVTTPFMVPVKVTMMASLMLVLPYVLYQIWAFIAPGLYKHEKQLALPLIFSSSVLFFAGMAYCYFIVFKMVFSFIAEFAPASITPAPDIEAYLGFVMTMFVAFGVSESVFGMLSKKSILIMYDL